MKAPKLTAEKFTFTMISQSTQAQLKGPNEAAISQICSPRDPKNNTLVRKQHSSNMKQGKGNKNISALKTVLIN